MALLRAPTVEPIAPLESPTSTTTRAPTGASLAHPVALQPESYASSLCSLQKLPGPDFERCLAPILGPRFWIAPILDSLAEPVAHNSFASGTRGVRILSANRRCPQVADDPQAQA